MQQHQRKTIIRLTALLATACWLLPATTHAAESSYLNALEAEADNISVTETPPETTTTNEKAKTAAPVGETLPAGLSQADFEETLKSGYFGSYLFYSKLGDRGKAAVYKEYQQNTSINHLREVIKAELTK